MAQKLFSVTVLTYHSRVILHVAVMTTRSMAVGIVVDLYACVCVHVYVQDVAGLVPGAYTGRGRGNAFLNDLCDADVLIHVSGRCVPKFSLSGCVITQIL